MKVPSSLGMARLRTLSPAKEEEHTELVLVHHLSRGRPTAGRAACFVLQPMDGFELMGGEVLPTSRGSRGRCG